MVEDIPLVVWGLCFGKVGGVISCLFGSVRGYHRTGPQCLPTPPFSASSIYAALDCVRGLGSVCYIWSTSPVLSSVLCEFKYAVSNSLFLSLFLSFFLSLGGPEPYNHASGLPGIMTPCCPQSTWPCCCSSFNCSACGYGTLSCSLDMLPDSDLLFSTL